MDRSRGYRRFPRIETGLSGQCVYVGSGEIAGRIAEKIRETVSSGEKGCITAIECYPGTDTARLRKDVIDVIDAIGAGKEISPPLVIESDELALEPEKIDEMIKRDLTEDPVFGIMTVRSLEDFFYPEKLALAEKRAKAAREAKGSVVIFGVGASLVCAPDILIYADITRWEIQLRYRAGMCNWRSAEKNQSNRLKYKRGYFAEWRWADKLKDKLLPAMDLYIDMTGRKELSMVEADAYRKALERTACAPFRTVPYFDPGVWGGNWMKRHFDLPENNSNYAWSFDGVPEENSLLLDFGGRLIETPALNLVLYSPSRLLGERVRARFGKEFPIRFDMLDTVGGQNLSLQVHPLTEYISENFNMRYTQDESYYILDATPGESCVYLGLKTGSSFDEMARDLKRAQAGGAPFEADRYINRVPVKKHDHILIPAGTVHCSGAGTMVLEISATPYIFTFKLWDWGRLDLDGRPRPVHIDRGLANIQTYRDTEWVKENLVNRIQTFYEDDDTRIERTGLHSLEFIETLRVSTRAEALVKGADSVYVINLVEGERALICSPDRRFEDFELFYAETCIIPAAAGDWLVRSPDSRAVSLIAASVR